MAYIVSKRMAWGAANDPDVVGYRVMWAIPPAVLDKANPQLNLNFSDVGRVTQINLPLEAMPKIDGELEIAIAAIDDVGNMSDAVGGIFPFDFQAPGSPGMPYLI